MKQKITQALADKTQAPPKGKTLLFADPELRGFYLIVGPNSRGYYVQSLVNGTQVRSKVGSHPAMTAKEARSVAAKTLVEMRAGKSPVEERRKAKAKGTTLAEALELHIAARPLAPRTVEDYRYYSEHYFGHLMGKTLVDIGRNRTGMRELHAKLSSKNGRTVADSAFRILRATYRRALKEHPDLPPDPTQAVQFHGQRRRKVTVTDEQLFAWTRAVLDLPPVRRDLHMFMLLTGMRRTATIEIRREHVNEACDTIHVPNPKGGRDRAFDLPLSGMLQVLVAERLAGNAILHRKSPWLFPSETSRSGHVMEVKEKALGSLTGHALRHLYATLAVEAGVPVESLKWMLNHKVASNDVTAGYIHPGLPYLRAQQDRASEHILGRLDLTLADTRVLALPGAA